MTLPDCMLPDGGDGPCRAYTELRNATLEEAARAMDAFRAELERAEIATSRARGPTHNVLFNPEQKLWAKAAAVIRSLKQ